MGMTGPQPLATDELDPAVVWHELECGRYSADLPLWRALAADVTGPVLDVGAGTGRVALELARAGHEVIALDYDPVLLGECARRARGLPVRTVLGDARALDVDARDLELCIVPMQTVQLLDHEGRAGFLRAARALTRQGGLLACALVEELQPFDEATGLLPSPDELQIGELTYSSQPTAVRELGDRVVLERRREITRGAERIVEQDAIDLHRVTPRELQRSARAAGWTPEPSRTIPATAEHVGATVVLLRG